MLSIQDVLINNSKNKPILDKDNKGNKENYNNNKSIVYNKEG